MSRVYIGSKFNLIEDREEFESLDMDQIQARHYVTRTSSCMINRINSVQVRIRFQR